jgi:hypothetical protein
MCPTLCCLRNVLLIALVGWGVVDDFFPSTPSPFDTIAEGDAYLPPESSGSRHDRSTKGATLCARVRLIDGATSSLSGRAISNAAAVCGLTPAGRLYALMSLQR